MTNDPRPEIGSLDEGTQNALEELPQNDTPAEVQTATENALSNSADGDNSVGGNANTQAEEIGEGSTNNIGDLRNPNGDSVPGDRYQNIIAAAETILEESHKIRAKINELEEREAIRLGNDYHAFLLWSKKRERLEPNDDLFYVYEEAWDKALALVQPLKNYIEPRIYKDVLFSVGLHYIIVEPFTFEKPNEQGGVDIVENPLYKKHKIDTKTYLISSASDEGSSSSIHVTNSLQNGDFLMQDLLRTRYGTWAYTILEQLEIGATLL